MPTIPPPDTTPTAAQLRARAMLGLGPASPAPEPAPAPVGAPDPEAVIAAAVADPAPAPEPAPTPNAVVPPDSPRRRRSPTKERTPAATAPVVPDPPHNPPHNPTHHPPSTATFVGGLVLVGCVSTWGSGVTLDAWAADQLARAAVDDTGRDHGHFGLVPYAVGTPKAIALILRDLGSGALVLPAVLSIEPAHPLAAMLVPALQARGSCIVRGVR